MNKGDGPAAAGEEKAQTAHRSGTVGLALASLGVVYGDIGTSPLYTMEAIFAESWYQNIMDDMFG